MAFNAATVVEKMDWDFTAFGGEKGTIPEPSQDAVEAYQKEVTEAVKDIQGLPGAQSDFTMEELNALMSSMGEVDFHKIASDVKDAIAKLCQNQPSREQLDLLPYRIFQAFQQWLQAELSPESSSVGTKPSLKAVPDA
jgi:hypothetical protein